MTFYHFRQRIRRLPGIVIREVPIPVPAVTEGFGSREKVGDICAEMGVTSVLVVTDRTIRGLGFHEKVTESLERRSVPFAIFSDIDSEPSVEIIRAGVEAAKACGADCIVTLGGGSVMDSGKIIAAGAKTPEINVAHYLHKFAVVPGNTLPMINIPTTAGTGAELTVGAVVKNSRGEKHSTVVIGLDIEHVILDSELTVGAPEGVTVWCGIDALSHGLEGLLSDTVEDRDDIHKSRECVKLVLENLPVLLKDPSNIEARQNMSLAAHYGGNAINRQLAGYIHAFAHSIGGLYHIPHGHAIALCMLPVLEHQTDVSMEPLAELAAYCGLTTPDDSPGKAGEIMLGALRELLDACGLERCCPAILREDYEELVRLIDADSINYSAPKTFTDEEIVTILDRIREGV